MTFNLLEIYCWCDMFGINFLRIGYRSCFSLEFDEFGLWSFHLLWIRIRG